MSYVICYDVRDDLRRDRVADLLKNYGRRVEYSVFFADLEDDLAAEMKQKLQKLLRPEDRAHIFALCGSCARRIVTLGTADVPKDEEFYIV